MSPRCRTACTWSPALTGFADAGSAVTQFSQYLLETLEVREIVQFDTDALLDYRARRPTMYFDQDHLTDYRPAKLSLYLAKDEMGQPFLLLTGFEPDFQWERFTQAVVQLVDRYQVKDTTWVHAIPMPTPHTRPIGVTVSGNRTELIDAMSIWRPHTQVPTNALHLLEYRLRSPGTRPRDSCSSSRTTSPTPSTRSPRSARSRASARPPG